MKILCKFSIRKSIHRRFIRRNKKDDSISSICCESEKFFEFVFAFCKYTSTQTIQGEIEYMY